jgi:hypothetical protein
MPKIIIHRSAEGHDHRRRFISEDNEPQTSDSAQNANLSREGKAHAVPRFPKHRFICELRTSESLP